MRGLSLVAIPGLVHLSTFDSIDEGLKFPKAPPNPYIEKYGPINSDGGRNKGGGRLRKVEWVMNEPSPMNLKVL
jgi:hypothetical protein